MAHTHDTQDDTNDSSRSDDQSMSVEPFTTNQIAATFPTTDIGSFDEELRQLGGVDEVEVFIGGEGQDALSPDSMLGKLQTMLSEERRPRERLDDTLAAGGSVVMVAHDGNERTILTLANEFEARGAGWVVNFGELTWTELGSPQTPESSGLAAGDE